MDDRYAGLRKATQIRNIFCSPEAIFGYRAAANPETIRALLADHDQWRQQAQYETDIAQAACERVKEVEAERDRLREALLWVSATLNNLVNEGHIAEDDLIVMHGEPKVVGQILGAADAALAQEGS